MSARLRRLEADYRQIQQDFNNHRYITVTPIGSLPPERYHVVYQVNGVFLKDDQTIENIKRHEIDIILHSDYPRFKPVVKIQTPIFHPNFNDGQVCIGDIWGAGETLSDIIVNIGNMIQYQSWNSYSPLSAEAAEWAIKNKFLFPVGDLQLYPGEYQDTLEKDVLAESVVVKKGTEPIISLNRDEYFEITTDELKGVKFVPSAVRMQSMINNNNVLDSKRINVKTIIQKGLVWGLIGGFIGWGISELLNKATSATMILEYMGYTMYDLVNIVSYDQASSLIDNAMRVSTAIFIAIVSGSLGAMMGYGEGFYYGSKENAWKYALKGLGISFGLGLVFGYIAQMMYSNLLTDNSSVLYASAVRGVSWAAAGLGAGLAIGLIKPEKKRIWYTSIGGLIGGFIGGTLFNYIYPFISTSEDDTGIFARLIGVVIMGLLVGVGVGMLEQFAKSAWLKVIRGEFEGKEYLVFSGTTSIGNTGSNSIVLFKDKLVGEHHCEIRQDGPKYVLTDKGLPQGTYVNGNKVIKHILRRGDAIGVGNTVLIFNVKEVS